MRATLPALLVFVAGAAISGFTLLRGIDPFDEGLALQAAARVAAGEVPYRDFLWAYGPAQPYLLAGLSELFGESLLTWRIVRVLVNGGIALVAYLLLRPRMGTPLALAAALVAAAALGQPLSANPFAPALLLALLAVWASDAQRPLGAAALTALAAAWRLDFGVYTGLACIAVLVIQRDRRALLRYAAVATGAALLAYLPFVVAVGPGDLWDALVARGLGDREYWTLPFPLEYEGPLSLRPHDVKDLLSFYIPLLLLVGMTIAIAIGLRRSATLPPLWGGLLVLGACFVLYLRSRTDPFHETPLLVTLALLLPLMAVTLPRRAAAAVLAIPALLGLYVLANRAQALLDPPRLERLRLEVADGVRVPPDEARALPPAVAATRGLTPDGGPIYVVTLRSDLVRIGNPLFYVLADRPNALDRDFDLQTSEAAQRRLVERLETERPGAIVRWTDPDSARREPNKRGEASGSRLLDEWLAEEYEPLGQWGDYVVMAPR